MTWMKVKRPQLTYKLQILNSGLRNIYFLAYYPTKILKNTFKPVWLLALSICILSCSDANVNTTPKPKGYFRIALPGKKYVGYSESCPFKFEYPTYSNIEKDNGPIAQPCWININYERFHAKLHISYKVINNNLRDYIEESRKLAIQHQVKASAMKESPIINSRAKVYGLVYEFGGNTASSIQFYLTDSTKHFMRGALYFFAAPNSDSIAPVYQFLKKDVYHLIETLEWRNDITVSQVAEPNLKSADKASHQK